MKAYTQKHSKETYSDIWLTPKETFNLLNNEFHFDIDVATEPNNPLGTPDFYTEKDNALIQVWYGNVFCNPPYSNIAEWVKKAYEEWYYENRNRVIVMLIPARTDTKYFHEYIAPYAEVRFIKGRLKFSEKGSAPFPSMVVIFGKKRNIKTQKRGIK